MSNVLSEEKKQQVIALGKLGWSLRRIERETSVRRKTAVRRILGVLSLMKKYGAAAVEDACATELDIGVHEYRSVRRYLECRPHPQMFLRQIDPLIRQLTEHRDFINLKTKEQTE